MTRPDWVHEHATICPYCGHHMPHLAACWLGVERTDTPPVDGDWVVCVEGCRRVAVYVVGAFGVGLRVMTPDEETEAAQHAGLRQAVAALAESYTVAEAVGLMRPETRS